MTQEAEGDATGAFDASVERIRDLNDRIAETARRGGEASLRAYERLLQTVADVQESGGSRTARFVDAAAKAQASFVREVAAASPDALKTVTERVSEVAGAATRQVRRGPDEDLPIPRYDELDVNQINQRLGRLSKVDLDKVEAYERGHKNRKSVLHKVSVLRRR